jgi:hypothetical protein
MSTTSSFPDSLRLAPGRFALGAVLAVAMTLSACDSGPSAPQVASVRVEAPSPVVVVGETIQLTAVPLDAGGSPIQGQTAIWSSSADQVLQVDAGGRVTGVSVGTATARAQVAGITGSRSLEVIPVPVATIEVDPPQLEITRGDEFLLDVTLRDAAGNELSDRVILFESGNIQIATVSVIGRVLGVRAGSTQITIRSGAATTVVPVTVLPGDEPVIEGLSADVIREGQELDILGRQFSPNSTLNTVRFAGEIALVLEAEATRLRVRVPNLVCAPTGLISVTVEVGGDESAGFPAPFQTDDQVTLAPGEFRLFPAGEPPCLRLGQTPGASSYLVGVQSASGTASLVTPVTVRGIRAQAPGAAADLVEGTAAADPLAATLARELSGAPFSTIVEDRLQASSPQARLTRRHEEAERHLREREQGLVSDLLRSGAAPLPRTGTRTMAAAGAPAGSDTGPASVPASAQVGDTFTVNIPDIRPGVSFCQVGIPVRTVVRRIGSGSIWLEDVENPSQGLSSSDYTLLGNQFDELTLPGLTEQFGAPTDIDGNGRIVIVISQQVNRFGGIIGFVVSSDFFPSTGANSCPASNQGEYYYSVTPDPTGQIPEPPEGNAVRLSLEAFRSLTPRLAAHEATHIIQFGRRLQTPGATSFASIWELEGQAVLAEEVIGLRALGLAPRQNLGLEVAFNTTEQSPTEWFANGFVDLAIYYGFESRESRKSQAPGACGWLGRREVSGPCDYGRLPYGVSWSFLRWLSDHRGDRFSGGEAELHQRLVEATVAGFPALVQVLGEPVPPLLAYWAASLYTDGRLPSGSDPLLSFPSWNLRAIDAGLVSTAHLQPVERGFEAFTLEQPVAAGSTLYTRISGGGHPGFAFRAASPAGTPLPSTMQLWVVRLQ